MSNKMVEIGTGILVIGLASAVVYIAQGAGLTGLGQGIRSFMLDVRVGIAANPTLAIIILAVAVMATLGILFMGIRALLKSSG
jgi:hypothetical protein